MIKVVSVGKIKNKELTSVIEDYERRLIKYTNLKIIEVDDVSYDDVEKSIELKYQSIMKQVKESDYLIVLDIDGIQLSSKELSNKLEQIFMNHSDIVFVIGGSNGLSPKLKEKARIKLSFSKLTFPHQLFRLMLMEQIYRSFKIMKNETYHK